MGPDIKEPDALELDSMELDALKIDSMDSGTGLEVLCRNLFGHFFFDPHFFENGAWGRTCPLNPK
jgi:hypothetical protein